MFVLGGVDICKKKWFQIRDHMRKTLKKRKTLTGQAARFRHKYRYEDALEFLLPHLRRRDSIKDIFGEDGDEFNDESMCLGYSQEQEIKEEPDENSNLPEETFAPHRTPSPETSSSSEGKERNTFTEPEESMEAQLLAYILAEKQLEKEKLKNEVNCHPVDAFLAAITPSLKTLNPLLLNQAKGRIFAVVQEFEMKQLTEEQK